LLGIAETSADQKSLHDALRREQDILRNRNVFAEMVTKVGKPVAEIAQRTEQDEFDIVFIGAEQRGNSGPFWRSAKAYKIIKTVHPSVLVVVGRPSQLRKILLCSSGTDIIGDAVELVGRLAAPLQATVTIMHVLPEPPVLYAEMIPQDADGNGVIEGNSSLGKTLRRHREQLQKAGITVRIELRHGIVGSEVLSALHHDGYDLVVTGKTLARGPIESYIMGDVTREIVNRAACPMLIVRTKASPPGLLRQFGSRLRRIFCRTRTDQAPPATGSPADRNGRSED
jgi:nucleotide-binding universal stress UspA family protein